MKKALIVVSFGTSVHEAFTCIENVEKAVRGAYPEADFYRAYTSGMIRRKLNGQGIKILSPEEALAAVRDAGYEDVHVQPTHIIPGAEYDRLSETCKKYSDRFTHLTLGRPLISNAEELRETAEVLAKAWRKQIPSGDALLFMGHGTEHIANFIYPALQTVFLTLGEKKTYLATVEGWPELSDVIFLMKEDGVKRVHLVPFLLTAGDHARNDMAGDGEDSWKNRLMAEGFEVSCHVVGMGELPEIIALYKKRA